MSTTPSRPKLALLCVGALLSSQALVGCVGQSQAEEPAPKLIFSDDFSGASGSAPNPKNWGFMTGGQGWGNQELECYTSSRKNSALDGHGYLVISARKQPGYLCAGGTKNNYTSARLSSQGLKAFTYGTIAMRAKMPTGQGAWPAFWALGVDHDVVGWPSSGELDVSEVVGFEGQVAHGTLHGPTATKAPYAITGEHRAPTDLFNAFHIYSMTWTANSVSWSFDGVPYFTVTKATVQKSGKWVFDHPFYLLLNVAVGGTWPGPPTATTSWPQQMVVDYVRVYEAG